MGVQHFEGEFLAFDFGKEFPAFLNVFLFFPTDFRGSTGKKILIFLVVFLALSPKSKEGFSSALDKPVLTPSPLCRIPVDVESIVVAMLAGLVSAPP